MPITYGFLADNLYYLISDLPEANDKDAIRQVFADKDQRMVAKFVDAVARDVRARVSTLGFPPEKHEMGTYRPSRNLGMATRYLNEISRAVDSGESKYTYDELGWHAFGAVVQAIAGIIQHFEQTDES